MSKKKIWLIIGIVIGCALLFIGGIYVGKKTVPVKVITKTKYLPGEPIHDVIDNPVPVYIAKPIDTANLIKQCVADGIFSELFPEKIITDTLYLMKEDTTKIMADWATKREYEETLFDVDTLGKLKINTYTQYNRLGSIDYTFTPVIKQQTTEIYNVRKFSPFVGAGLSTFPSYDAEVGFFYRESVGVSIEGSYYPKLLTEDMQKYSVSLKVLKKF